MIYFLNKFFFILYNLIIRLHLTAVKSLNFLCSSFINLCFRTSSFLMHKYKRHLFSWYLLDWEYAFKNNEFSSKQVIYEESSKVRTMGRSHLSYNLDCSSLREDSKNEDWFKNHLGSQEIHSSQLIDLKLPELLPPRRGKRSPLTSQTPSPKHLRLHVVPRDTKIPAERGNVHGELKGVHWEAEAENNDNNSKHLGIS